MQRLTLGLLLTVLVAAACGGPSVVSPSPTQPASSTVASAAVSPAATGSASGATASGESAAPSASAAASGASPAASADAGSADVLAAAEATIAEETVRVDQTIEFRGSNAIPEGTSASAEGQAKFGTPRQMRLTADFSSLGQGEIVMIVDDTLIYMRGQAFEQLAGEGKWLLIDLDSDSPAAAPFKSLATGQNDVGMAMVYLYGFTGEVDSTDAEEIRGVATRRYQGTADLEAARDSVPGAYTEPLEEAIAALRVAGIEREVEAEAWVGDDGLVHRVRYVYTLGAQQGGGEMETVIDFSDFGAPMELGIPDADEVVNIEDVAPA